MCHHKMGFRPNYNGHLINFKVSNNRNMSHMVFLVTYGPVFGLYIVAEMAINPQLFCSYNHTNQVLNPIFHEKHVF